MVKKWIDYKFDILPWAFLKGGGDGADGCLRGVFNGLSMIIEKNTELFTVLELSRS